MRLGILAVGFVILVAGAISVSAGVPTVWSPFPFLTVIPAFMVASTPINQPDFAFRSLALPVLAAAPIAATFVAWSVRPVAKSKVPIPSLLLFGLVCVLSLVAFIGGWGYGIQYQGFTYTVILAAINVILAVSVAAILLRHRAAPSQRRSLAFHGMLFLWLAWFAFPWLGELP